MAMFPYPGSAALALNNLSSLAGQDDDQPKKPVLYRAGQAVGTGLNAAHQVAASVDTAADQAISSGVNAAKTGVSNFVRGVQGQPALNAPAPDVPDPTSGSQGSNNVLMLIGNPAKPSTLARAVGAPSGADQTAGWWSRMGQPATALATPPASAVPAGQLPVAPVLRPASETGVTVPDGRKLPYGAMVNGVPTFSDGSGGFAGHAASIPRTMTDAEISSLGGRLNTVPASALTNAVDPYSGQSSDQAVASLVRGGQGSKFGISPQQDAAADLAAVSNQDPRSTLGRAALNASRSANAASTTLQRKAALGNLANLQDAVAKTALENISDPAALARVNAENQATLQRQTLANQGDIARQNLANEGDLARADLTGQYDVLSRMAQGQTKTTLTDKDLNAQAIKLLPQVLGLNALGQMDDKGAPGGSRPATQQEIADGLARAKAIIQGQLAPSGGPNDAQIAFLKQNPSLRGQFDQKFGAGAAAKVLGN